MNQVYDGRVSISKFLMDQILGILPMINETIHDVNGAAFRIHKSKSLRMLAGIIEMIGSSINSILPQVRLILLSNLVDTFYFTINNPSEVFEKQSFRLFTNSG